MEKGFVFKDFKKEELKCKDCYYFRPLTNAVGHVCDFLEKPCFNKEHFKPKKIEIKEMVNHPSHYNKGKFEVIEVIEDWNLNFNLGNAVKYISRCEHKGNKKQDLEKAVWYLQRELDKLR